MAKRRRGRSDAFSAAQNRALRVALNGVAGEIPNQETLAKKLGVVQQSASRLLNDKHSGFSYPTALAVVKLAGFSGVEAFFVAKGLAPSESTPVLEDAQLHAREAG